MMLNMFRKVSFFFFMQISIPTRPCFQTLSLHTHRYTHTHTHTGTHTHRFPKDPSSFFLCYNVTAHSEHQERSSESLTGAIVK